MRLDVYMCERGMCESRERAKSLIKDGQVFVNDKQCAKPSMTVNPDDDKCEIRGEVLKYVSRGGLKLEKAINEFSIVLTDRICIDIGASTGGFTDCMLQNGAKRVFSIDVGSDQLADKLKQDSRVVNMEKTNIRTLTCEKLGHKADFASIDVSFISLKLVLPVVYDLLTDSGELVCLIKPQFEAGRENIGKKGVVKDKRVHKKVCTDVISYAMKSGFCPVALSFSPIKGPEGNIEYLLYLSKIEDTNGVTDEIILRTIEKSHENLD